MRTSEAFRGRKEVGMGCRDTQLTNDESLRACVDILLSWDDELAQSGTSLGWQVCKSVDWQHVHKNSPLTIQHELGRLTRESLVMIKIITVLKWLVSRLHWLYWYIWVSVHHLRLHIQVDWLEFVSTGNSVLQCCCSIYTFDVCVHICTDMPSP